MNKVDIQFPIEVKRYIDLQCNGDISLYTEFPELKHIDIYLKELQPKNVVDIGSGIGRASVYFLKKYGWSYTSFNLLDGNIGDKQVDGIRNVDGEFYNSFDMAKIFCESNGLFNARMLDAGNDQWIHDLTDIDFAYSFLAIGFHWPLHFYLDRIYPLLLHDALLVFGIRGLEKKEWIYKQILNISKYDILKFVHMPTCMRESVLVLRKK